MTDPAAALGPLRPRASGEQPGLAAPDASRVTQVRARARARSVRWFTACPVTLAPEVDLRSVTGGLGAQGQALSARSRQVAPGLRTGLSGVHLPAPLLADFLPELEAVFHVGLSFYIGPLLCLFAETLCKMPFLCIWVSS